MSVVLGAVLAIAGGVATELWKQRKAARAAARLVWLELILARSALLGALALREGPDDLPFSDDAWTAQRDRLALGRQTKAFRDVQTAYLQLQAIAATPPEDRGDAALFWPALVPIDRAAEAVGKAARVEKRELEQFRRPLAERLEETRTFVEQVRAAGPERISGLARAAGGSGGGDRPPAPHRPEVADGTSAPARPWRGVDAGTGASGGVSRSRRRAPEERVARRGRTE